MRLPSSIYIYFFFYRFSVNLISSPWRRKTDVTITHIYVQHIFMYMCQDNFVESARLRPSKRATQQHYQNQSTSSPLLLDYGISIYQEGWGHWYWYARLFRHPFPIRPYTLIAIFNDGIHHLFFFLSTQSSYNLIPLLNIVNSIPRTAIQYLNI